MENAISIEEYLTKLKEADAGELRRILPIFKKHSLDVIALGSSVKEHDYNDIDLLIHGYSFNFLEALNEAFGGRGWYFSRINSEERHGGYAGTGVLEERRKYVDHAKPRHRKCSPIDINFSSHIDFDETLPRVDLVKNPGYREVLSSAKAKIDAAYKTLEGLYDPK
jgi:hypothetical protein